MTLSALFPLIVTALGGLGIGGIVVALINKRETPLGAAQSIIDQMQEERASDLELQIKLREVLERTEGKVDKLYEVVGKLRDYGTAWELWHADGMPDPPGRPRRPELNV